MAKAHSFIPKDDPQFFPEQNGADSRGAPADRFTLRSPDPANAANTNEKEQPWIDAAPAIDESDVWNRYESSGSAMFDKPDINSKNVHSSSRWLVRGAVAAFFIAGVGIAALTYNSRSPAEPAVVEDASSTAAAPVVQNPREAMATDPAAASPLGGASGAAAMVGPTATTPEAVKPAAPKPAPVAKTASAKPAPKAIAPAAPSAADAAAAPTYSQGPAAAPATSLTPTSPAQPTNTLPSTVPSTAPSAAAPSDPAAPPPTLTPTPVPGSAQTVPEITPGNEPTPQ